MSIIVLILLAILALIAAGWLAIVITGFVIKLALVLIIAALASALAQSILKYKGGVAFTFASGLVGAVIGILIQRILGAPSLLAISGVPLLWAFVGSAVVVFAAKLTGIGRNMSLGRRPF